MGDSRVDVARLLRRAADDPEIKELQELADRDPLSEDLLARYYAGLLEPELEREVEWRAALGERNALALAQIEQDIASAAAGAEPRRTLRSKLRDAWVRVLAVAPPRRLALAASAVIIVAVISLVLRPNFVPPGDPRAPYESPLLTRERGGAASHELELPGGEIVDRVDPDWPLHRPVGEVTEADWYTWQPLVPKGTTYSFRLLSATGALLYETAGISEPYLRLPRSVRRQLHSGGYLWIIESESEAEWARIRAAARFSLLP